MPNEPEFKPIIFPEAGPAKAVPESVEATLAQRLAQYGDFSGVASLAEALLFEIEQHEDGHAWNSRLNAEHRFALLMIVTKIARIVNGDPNYTDNWHDIAGYARLIEDRINQKTEKKR